MMNNRLNQQQIFFAKFFFFFSRAYYSWERHSREALFFEGIKFKVIKNQYQYKSRHIDTYR